MNVELNEITKSISTIVLTSSSTEVVDMGRELEGDALETTAPIGTETARGESAGSGTSSSVAPTRVAAAVRRSTDCAGREEPSEGGGETGPPARESGNWNTFGESARADEAARCWCWCCCVCAGIAMNRVGRRSSLLSALSSVAEE